MTILPDHLLRLMSPADRAKLGPGNITSEEAFAAYECKTERELQQLLIRYLTAHRGVERVIWSRLDRSITCNPGTPDLIFVFKGVPVAFECKTPTGKLSTAQHQTGIAMLKDGWHWRLIRTFAEAKDALDFIESQC